MFVFQYTLLTALCSVWVQTIDRVQQTLRFSLIWVDQFVPLGVVNSAPKQHTILTETTTYWINVSPPS